MSGLTVSVIVLNWNGGRLVERCVAAVYEQTYGPVELIIVDNGSSDGSLKRLQDLYPRAKYILNEQNLGFSRAVNQGIQSAGGEYILPLNLDVIMTNDFVEKMVSTIESGERVGSVSGKLLRFREDEGTDIIDSTGHVICRNRYVLNRGDGEEDAGQYDTAEPVFGTCGAAPLYKRRMLDDIAVNGEVFDEDFFIMLEDIDVDWRARLRGWDCLYNPKAVARHVRSASGVSKNRVLQRHYYKNRFLLMMKNDLVRDQLAAVLTIGVMNVMLTVDILFTAPVAMVQGWWDIVVLGPRMWRKRRTVIKRRTADVKGWFQRYDYADVKRKLRLA